VTAYHPGSRADLHQLIDIPTLARHLSTSVRHIRRLVAEKRIPYIKVGHLIRFDPDDIAAWLSAARVMPNGDWVPRGPSIVTPWIGDHHRPRQTRP
jgi:excisionase family DNA binding protein